jgi:predicted GNAT family acetyltransferase
MATDVTNLDMEFFDFKHAPIAPNDRSVATSACGPSRHIALPHERGRLRGKADVASSHLATGFMGTRPKSRPALLHTEVPQELSGQGYGSRLAHGVFEALHAMEKGDRGMPLHVFLRRSTPRVRRAPRWLIEDGRDARAHSAFGRRYQRLSNA